MLSSTPHQVHGWISPGFLAFSSNRPFNPKEEPATCCPWLSLLSIGCSSRARQHGVFAVPAASGAVQRKVGLCSLRGGSGETGPLPQSPPGGEPRDFHSPTIPTATPEQGFEGVALVTERSMATGGGRGQWFYRVLPDGTLQVGQSSVSTDICFCITSSAYSVLIHQFVRNTAVKAGFWFPFITRAKALSLYRDVSWADHPCCWSLSVFAYSSPVENMLFVMTRTIAQQHVRAMLPCVLLAGVELRRPAAGKPKPLLPRFGSTLITSCLPSASPAANHFAIGFPSGHGNTVPGHHHGANPHQHHRQPDGSGGAGSSAAPSQAHRRFRGKGRQGTYYTVSVGFFVRCAFFPRCSHLPVATSCRFVLHM